MTLRLERLSELLSSSFSPALIKAKTESGTADVTAIFTLNLLIYQKVYSKNKK